MRCSCCATGSGDKRPIAELVSGVLLRTHKPTVTNSSIVALLSLVQQTHPWKRAAMLHLTHSATLKI